MKGYLIVFALCVLGGVLALPQPKPANTRLMGRIGGGVAATLAPHACMILVYRAELEPGTAALGSGSIISTRHAVTAAHLVQGTVTNYQIGFFPTATTRRLVNSTFALIHQDYDATTFASDIALIFLQGTATFPQANVITLTPDAACPAQSTELITVGFGFTAADSTGAASDPYAAAQAVADPCEFDNFNLTDTHYCAEDSAAATWVCPGDNGAGCFSSDGTEVANNRLVGLVSRVLTGCAESQLTGYTCVGLFVTWISNITGIPVPTFIANYNKEHNL